jgi:inner membrane protein
VLANDGQQFTVMDRRGIYKTGAQILPERVTMQVGTAATIEIQTLTLNDEAIAPVLQKLAQAYPNAAIFLSGAVTLDFPEDVRIPYEPDQLVTAAIGGAVLTLNHQPIEKAILMLSDQWGLGNLEVKIISPRP